jgi:Zn-dependent protease
MRAEGTEFVMRNQVILGRVFGIDIGVHYTWGLVALMISFSLAGGFTIEHPEWGETVAWAAAILTSVLFFVALILHELAHALAARAQGLVVRSITLFALGGQARIEGEPADAKSEFRMAIVGPLVSMLIGAVCLAGAWAAGRADAAVANHPIVAIAEWLGYINLCLAAFNMIPGFPLDGGRVLRALVWQITGDAHRATRIASQIGRGVAVLFMIGGVLWFTSGAGFGALWVTFIGWFLFDAAGTAYKQLRITDLLSRLRVSDLMVRDCPHVDLWTNLETFVTENDLLSARFCYIVTNQGQPIGLISAREVRAIAQPLRPYKTVWDAMRPVDDSPSVTPDSLVTDALETMGKADVSQLPVAADGHIEGIISRASVLGFLQAHGHLRT